MKPFRVIAPFRPAGDQSQAIDTIVNAIKRGEKYVTLKGVTGSGKTFTMAKVVEAIQKPALIISHNKTLSAQLYREFKEFSQKMPLSILCLIMIITSQKRMSLPKTSISKKIQTSMRR